MRFVRAAFVLLLLVACGGKTKPGAPPPPLPPSARRDMIVLLPDPETQTFGGAVVSSLGESVELTHQRPATRVVPGHRPNAPFEISEADVQRLFGDALAAEPPAPREFLLYFRFDSDQLTPESESRLTEVLAFVTNRPAPDVMIVGHTDTMGPAQLNIDLGRSRAIVVRDRLVAAGLNADLISVASHGEADLLVATPDETLEPRNRRVEVSVR